jgi:hypothetical protein
LDGELWMGPGNYQRVTSCCRSLVPPPEWEEVKYLVFDRPSLKKVFADGIIDNPNMKKTLVWADCLNFCRKQSEIKQWSSLLWVNLFQTQLDFKDIQVNFDAMEWTDRIRPLIQIKLPVSIEETEKLINTTLDAVIGAGGEGLILRRPFSEWAPERSHSLLKVKPDNDMEVTVVGYIWGEETDKGSKLLGLMGSAICRLDNGLEFCLSGFTEKERQMIDILGMDVSDVGAAYPGQKVIDKLFNPLFPRGSKITIKYRELTDRGIPKEARYLRKRED